MQQQLAVKDNQIDELPTMLKASHEQQSTLVTALSAAQEASHRDKKRKGFFSRIFEQIDIEWQKMQKGTVVCILIQATVPFFMRLYNFQSCGKNR